MENGFRALIPGTLFAMALTGCSAPPVMYDASNPATLRGCPDAAPGADLVTRSYAATLKALSELKWRFDHVLPQQGSLVATACYGRSVECMTMVFSVDKDGWVTATRSPTQARDPDMDVRMSGWLRLLEQKFSVYRCMSMDVAIEELKQYGAIQESPAPPP
jgi:hypothetical protein